MRDRELKSKKYKPHTGVFFALMKSLLLLPPLHHLLRTYSLSTFLNGSFLLLSSPIPYSNLFFFPLLHHNSHGFEVGSHHSILMFWDMMDHIRYLLDNVRCVYCLRLFKVSLRLMTSLSLTLQPSFFDLPLISPYHIFHKRITQHLKST